MEYIVHGLFLGYIPLRNSDSMKTAHSFMSQIHISQYPVSVLGNSLFDSNLYLVCEKKNKLKPNSKYG